MSSSLSSNNQTKTKKKNSAWWLNNITGWLLSSLDFVLYLFRWIIPSDDYLFFTDGYGNTNQAKVEIEKLIKNASNGEVPESMIIRHDSSTTSNTITWGDITKHGSVISTVGHFTSPLAHALPIESKLCRFHHVQPIHQKHRKPITVILFPSTGEAGKRERLATAKYLADNHGWSSIIPTAPLHGARKPQNQCQFFTRSINLLLLQTMASIQEGCALAIYFLEQSNDHKVCFSGFSAGGGTSLAAAAITLLLLGQNDKTNNYGKRMACAPYAGVTSPKVMVKGLLKHVINWDHASLKERQQQQQDDDNKNKNNNDDSSRTMDKVLSSPMQKVYAALSYVDSSVFSNIVCEINTKRSPGDQIYIGSCSALAMKHDHVITQEENLVVNNEVLKLAGKNTKQIEDDIVQWLPGGHVIGRLVQPIYQKHLIEKAVCGLSDL